MNILKFGMQNSLVTLLQSYLNSLNLYSDNLDGIFGIQTLSAVKSFQKNNNLIQDGVVGPLTWGTLFRSTDIVPTNINYTHEILKINILALKNIYPFLEIQNIGYSVLGQTIPSIKIGTGTKQVFYNAAFHANEWITSILLMKFIENFSKSYTNNSFIFGYNANYLFNNCSVFIVPMVNPDGVDLVNNDIPISSPSYYNTKQISNNYPNIPFPSGWKANINGVDLNLQFPANWQRAKQIKYSQGFTSPAPRDFVGYGPLTQPEALNIYNFTLQHNFRLILAYHTQGEIIYWKYDNFLPAGSLYIGERFSDVSRYELELTPPESASAGYKDWFIQNYNRPGYTIEAGLGQSPVPLSQFNKIYNDNIGILVLGTIL